MGKQDNTASLESAVTLHRRGKLKQAEKLYRKVLSIHPGDYHAMHLLGLLLYQTGRYPQAEKLISKAIALNAMEPGFHINLASVLGELGRVDEAMDSLRRALELNADIPEAHVNLGNFLFREGQRDEAAMYFRQALSLNPNMAEALNSYGNVLRDQGKFDDSLTCFSRAIEVRPKYSEAYINMGGVLREQNRLDEAIAGMQRFPCIRADPAVMQFLGDLYRDCGRVELASEWYRGAAHCSPGTGVRIKRATLLPAIVKSKADMLSWREHFATGISDLLQCPGRIQDPVAEVGYTNFYLSYHGLDNRKLQISAARMYLENCPSLPWVAPHCEGKKQRAGPIRIGLISKFMYNHSIGKTSCGFFEQLDPARFRTYALFLPPFIDDEISRFIREHAGHSILLPQSLEGARRAIAELELDVLFYQEVGMDALTYFLAFSRLAPVQCVSFGHPETTGIPNMDYFISSDLFETDYSESHYSESLFKLQNVGTLAYYYPPEPAGRRCRRSDFGLPEDKKLYICPQTLFKIHPEFDRMIGEVLRADRKGCVVLIKSRIPDWMEILKERLRQSIPDVIDRVLFVQQQGRGDFVSFLAQADVILDTLHFNGMNTSLEAFSAGVPVVTLPAEFQRGRHTSGMYRKMGIHDCVARDAQHYVEIAVALGMDQTYRQDVARRILARKDVLFRDAGVVSGFEQFFMDSLFSQ